MFTNTTTLLILGLGLSSLVSLASASPVTATQRNDDLIPEPPVVSPVSTDTAAEIWGEIEVTTETLVQDSDPANLSVQSGPGGIRSNKLARDDSETPDQVLGLGLESGRDGIQTDTRATKKASPQGGGGGGIRSNKRAGKKLALGQQGGPGGVRSN